MTPDQIQSQLNLLQAELDALKSNLSEIPNSSDHYIPQPGEVVLIDDNGDDFAPRIFVKYNKYSKHPFECVIPIDEEEYKQGKEYRTNNWRYCKQISGEIIEFGCDKYTHLLPTGYEFCTEEQAEKWVKVENLNTPHPQMKIGYIATKQDFAILPEKYKNYYCPIRPIQYHVQVHEAVTAEPNPYAVDWANAPAYADSHTFEFDDYGWWRGSYLTNDGWIDMAEQSGFTLPTGLDWKQSKTVRPK